MKELAPRFATHARTIGQSALAMLSSARVRLVIVWLVIVATARADDAPINPYPRSVIDRSTVAMVDFSQAASADHWKAHNDCTAKIAGGRLVVTATGSDPIVGFLPVGVQGPIEITFRIRSTAPGGGQFFWTTDRQGWTADQHVNFHFPRDGRWFQRRVTINTTETIERLRFDPSTNSGKTEVTWLHVRRITLHPLEIRSVSVSGTQVSAQVRNHGDQPRSIRSAGTGQLIAPGAEVTVQQTAVGEKPFESVELVARSQGLPPVRRRVWLHHTKRPLDGITLHGSGDVRMRIARDGTGARIFRQDQLVAILSPLVAWPVGKSPMQLDLVESTSSKAVFQGPQIRSLTIEAEDDVWRYRLDASEPREGPVLRVLGELQQGLLPGVEYLGRGERSSSTLDIRTPEHIRFAPDPMDVTMPLMALVTAEANVALLWSDTALQPIFATPNFFDGTPDHRLALRGKHTEATIRITPGWDDGQRLEETILWTVRHRGLPPLPKPPRSWAAQKRLAMAALDGPLNGADGWGHCAQARWPRNWYADHASTLFRLTGRLPELPRLVPGGAHVLNPACYLLSGRADEMLAHLENWAASLRQAQQTDGSYRYQGKYIEGHFEDTASGLCGHAAATLMRHAWSTGNAKSLEAGLRALAFARRFRTPRGAQTWECPLHTPDIMASGYLTMAHTLAYRMTGDASHLAAARRWALTGLPFVYQWSNQPIMAYATTAVFGATNWIAPNWIGQPVQWCGLTYAESLLLLAEHDQAVDWRKLADGITTCGEQMQYPDGPSIGCLPDSFNPSEQFRLPPDINPCALVSLRMRLRGELDGVAVAISDRWRVMSPFPVTIDQDQARVEAHEGLTYQLIVFQRKPNLVGSAKPRVVEVVSEGRDQVPLEPPH